MSNILYGKINLPISYTKLSAAGRHVALVTGFPGAFERPIVTEIKPGQFYRCEEYHQQYPCRCASSF